MEIRKVRVEDIDALTDNRIEFVSSITSIANKDEFKERTRAYLKNHINDGSLLCYIAVEDEKIISSCLLCIYATIPIPSCLNGISGLLLNVYTLKEYRRKGIAAKNIKKLMGEAKLLGVNKISLDYTDNGYPLYQSLGFKKLDRQMEIKLWHKN